jgi:hypothetical protein
LKLLSDAWSGNAKLQGLTTQLNLTGHEYNIALVRSGDFHKKTVTEATLDYVFYCERVHHASFGLFP